MFLLSSTDKNCEFDSFNSRNPSMSRAKKSEIFVAFVGEKQGDFQTGTFLSFFDAGALKSIAH